MVATLVDGLALDIALCAGAAGRAENVRISLPYVELARKAGGFCTTGSTMPLRLSTGTRRRTQEGQDVPHHTGTRQSTADEARPASCLGQSHLTYTLADSGSASAAAYEISPSHGTVGLGAAFIWNRSANIAAYLGSYFGRATNLQCS